MIHRVRRPCARTMAFDTIRREQLGYMVRIARPGEVCRVTLIAVLIREGIVAAHVTLSALEDRMRAGQGELRRCMVE